MKGRAHQAWETKPQTAKEILFCVFVDYLYVLP